MRLRSLSAIRKTKPDEMILAEFPRSILITTRAMQKALAVNGLVRRIHGGSFEWYGFTLGMRSSPECIIDIGIPVNDRNVERYAQIGAENISSFQDSLPDNVVINGWIHSHGKINLRGFSRTDELNHLTVLDYVSTSLNRPVSRREVIIEDLRLITARGMKEVDKSSGSVWIVTDEPVSRAGVFELVYGSFCYGIVVGDGGWHRQEIYCRTRGILTGVDNVESRRANLLQVESGRTFTGDDREALAAEVRNKIKPERHEQQSGAHASPADNGRFRT